MEQGIISKEFYIGRYIYLTAELHKLPRVSYNNQGGRIVLSVRWTDTSGKEKRRRISQSNPEWEKYSRIATRRADLEFKLKKLLSSWDVEYGGSLAELATHYVLKPNATHPFDSEFYDSLKEDNNSYPKDRKIIHNGMIMRSFFESDVAQVLENLGIDYKYEVCFRLGKKDMSPDFSMDFPEFNRCSFLEAIGGMGNLSYVQSNAEKFANYTNNGLYLNRDIIFITGDESYRPDEISAKRIIGVMLDALAKMYVFRKT